ncbi:unnamed protein product [Caenorhabditis brenneri]
MKTSWLLLSTVVVLLKITTQSDSPNSTCDISKEFDCGTECIPKYWQCDNIKDCENGADEIDCEPNDCSEDQMLCDYGVCVPGIYKCDGHKDCQDRSDEWLCTSHWIRHNSSFNFGDPNNYKNNDGYDKNGCLPGFGLCGVQQLCIPNQSFCDGVTDCVNEKEDELHCTSGGPCKKNYFWDDQVCIIQTELCNGKKECPLGDDESEKCSECSTKHCEYQCRNTPTGAKCECDKGYRLHSDGVSCVDIDECTFPERSCDHFCENTNGSFRCSCAKGYHLKADGKTCELSDTYEGFLLLTEYNEIKKRPLKDFTETNFTTVYKHPEGRCIRAFDYSGRDNKFYMSIERSGVGPEKLVVEQNGTLKVLCENSAMKTFDYLAVDWIGNNLFFQEEEFYLVEGKFSSSTFISVCTMDGRFYRRLVDIEDNRDVRGFAIDPMRGLLFWLDSPYFASSKKRYPHRIVMANMDGSQMQTIVRSKLGLRDVFAIDHVHNDIYYEAQDDRIRRVNIDSKKTDVVASNLDSYSETMIYHNGLLYLTSLNGQLRVLEVAKKDARVHRILNKDRASRIPRQMVVNDTLHQLEPSAGNPCTELDCPWICVILPGFTAKCLCPDGYTPSILGTTCIPPSEEYVKHDNLTHVGSELMSGYCKAGVGCLNGGSCREVSNKTRIVCDCVEPYDGLYCERRKPMVSDETVLIMITVIILLLIFTAISVSIYCFLFTRSNKKNGVADIVLPIVTTQSTTPNSKCNLTEQFDCGSECIPRTWECDNMKDCQNGADEIDCEPNDCPDGQMLCDSGGCVPAAFKCDGHRDCHDRSDETYCGHISYRLSENSSFNFEDPNHYKYDGGYDKNGCLPGFGLCGIQQLCIPNRSFCDGTQDCTYYSDENHCTPGGPGGKKEWSWKTPENPCENMFACKKSYSWDDQKCINQTELCNGKKDCPRGDDESEKCSECSTKHCEYQCKNTPTGAKCVCESGYRLDSDNVTCVDLDECTLPERACHHFCENTIGSFHCSCAKGYHLKVDEKSCELSDTSEGFLLLSKFDEIERRPLKDFTETEFTTVYKTPEGQYIKAFDFSRRDDKFFMSIASRGAETEKLVVEQNGSLRVLCENAKMKKYKHLAVDWIGNNLFFQEEEVYQNEGKNSSKNFISVCTMDGRFYRRLIEIEDGRDVKGFAIHPMRGLLFWHDSFIAVDAKKRYPYRMMMANMDGTQVQLLVRSKSRLSEMFAIDYVNNDVYYEISAEERVRRVNIDSRKTEVVASNLWYGSNAMAYHNGFLYWTNLYGELQVLEVSKNIARVHRVLESGSGPFHTPHLVVNDSLHQLEPSGGNPCADLDCPWICVIVPDFTAKCLCPDGHTPSVLGTTCVSSLPEVGDHDNLTYIGLELMSEYCKAGVGCRNGGTCREVSNRTRIVCDCLDPYDGLYCERRKPMVSDEAVLIIVLLLLLIAIGFGIYYLFFIRRIGKKEAAEIVLSVVCLSILDECLENNGTTGD